MQRKPLYMEMIQTELPFTDKKPIFQRLGNLAEIANMPTAEREKYQRSLDAYRTNVATYAWERAEGRAEGEAIGRAEGEAIGLEKGEAIGLEKGREEKAIEMARVMLQDGEDIEKIMRYTNFSKEQIESL